MNLGLKSEMEEIRNETQKMEIKLEIEKDSTLKTRQMRKTELKFTIKKVENELKAVFITGK